MNIKKRGVVLSFFILSILLSACTIQQSKSIHLIDAKIANAIDENLMPVKVTANFPKGTSQVFCWFKWKDAKIDTEILAKWHYATDNIRILDYTFKLPRKEGSGSVSLSMPEGKSLPEGSYRIDLVQAKRTLRSLNFKVE